ncbi:MAG: co-chaperone DjlA [Gammaproteobacteria bacterium]|nr:MAG: co-chaperone DjlA [Gammaproteobacteria bacterium]
MSWWGKVVGGTFGYILLGGPLGALLGAALGHQFDKGFEGLNADASLSAADMENIQAAFFTATFSIMGYLAKADGRVSEDEIAMAERVMQQMQLDASQRNTAIQLFNEGKHSGFPLDDALRQFRKVAHRRKNLLQMFLEIQVYAAFADGMLHESEDRLLQHIFRMLGFSRFDYEAIAGRVQAEMHLGARQQRGAGTTGASTISESDAYAVLGVNKNVTDAEVKKAYRRLMNQHHPDKLVSKGMPEEMIEMATEKTHKIRAAYDRVKEMRGMKK